MYHLLLQSVLRKYSFILITEPIIELEYMQGNIGTKVFRAVHISNVNIPEV